MSAFDFFILNEHLPIMCANKRKVQRNVYYSI